MDLSAIFSIDTWDFQKSNCKRNLSNLASIFSQNKCRKIANFIDTEEAPQKKSAHFLSSLSPSQYVRGAMTTPHTCGCDVTGLGLGSCMPRCKK